MARTVSAASNVPLWEPAPLETERLKLWISEAQIFQSVTENDGEKAHSYFCFVVTRIFIVFSLLPTFVFQFHINNVIQNVAIAIKVLFNVLDRMEFYHKFRRCR